MISEAICLDANILVSNLDPAESYHLMSHQLIQSVYEKSWPIYIPAVFLFEAFASVYKKRYLGLLSEDQASNTLEMLQQLPFLIHADLDILQEAKKMASQLGLKRMNDFTYIAVAKKRKIPFVTLDEQLIKSGRQFYPDIFHVKEYPPIS